jgi:sugar lactone lactonase YvrE
MIIERQDPLAQLVAAGFVSLEGPVVDPAGDLYVADLRAGGVHRVRPNGAHRIDAAPGRTGIGGISLHASGGIVVSGPTVDHIRGRETRVLLDLHDLVDRPGTVAAGFNDIVADSRGRVIAGVLRQDAGGLHVPGELVRIAAPHEYEVVHADLHPNGLAWSPDGRRLYAGDTFRRRLVVFDATGALPVEIAMLATDAIHGLPDGIASDEDGGVWVAFYRGGCIARIDPDRDRAVVMEMPAPKPLSLCFDTLDPATLYVVTGRSEPGAPDTGSIYRIHTSHRGTPVPVATI